VTCQDGQRDIPSCGSGLWAQFRFVLRELHAIWRQFRAKREEHSWRS